MVLPQPFTTASPAIASYDYTDIESGLGFVNYYCMHTSDNDYILIDRTDVGSGVIQHYVSNTGVLMEETFAVTINIAKTIKGIAYTQIPVSSENASHCTVISTVKVNGNSIGTVTTTDAVIERASSTTLVNQKITLTETNLAAGDTLQFYVKISWADPGSNFGYAAHDPLGGSFTSRIDGSSLAFRTTRMGVAIPFRLDI